MEFFRRAKAVRLKSHLDKYLIADEDEKTVRQSRQGSSIKAKWVIEFVEGNNDVIHLKSCFDKYLAAIGKPYGLGLMGKEVVQIESNKNLDSLLIDWVPIRDGFQVKLRTRNGKYLRANGGTPPWRNSITHGIPHQTTTQNWVLWDVEIVDLPRIDLLYHSFGDKKEEFDSPSSPSSPSFKFSRFSSLKRRSSKGAHKQTLGMELLQNAKTIRLRTHQKKYLLASEDEESITQDYNGSSKTAKWTVEFIQDENFIRLKSCFDKYLTASNIPFIIGNTGKRVLQSLPKRLDSSSIEWEPIREGFLVKLKSRSGNFLCANGGLPPWRYSVTHDISHRNSTHHSVLWEVEILELQAEFVQPSIWVPQREHDHHHNLPSEPCSPINSPKLYTLESIDSFDTSFSTFKEEGRMIFYSIADENGDEGFDCSCLNFKGNEVDELTQKLEEETGLEDIIVCTKSPLDGKLYPLHLQLPPNNATMYVVVVQAKSEAGRDLVKALL